MSIQLANHPPHGTGATAQLYEEVRRLDGIKVEWSEEDQEYVATHPSYPSLSWLDPDPNFARHGLEKLMTDEGLSRMTKDAALQILMDAADCWARELVDYIAPASDNWDDQESAEGQRDYASQIWEAIQLLRGED